MLDKLENIKNRVEELNKELSNPLIFADNKKMVEITLYTYTLYYSTKPESYLKRSTSLASSDFSSP